MACYHRILVALDGSPDAAAALAHAATLARDQNALLTLLTVAPRPAQPVAVGASQPPDLLDVHEQLLREAADSLPPDVGVTTRLERGNAAETILRLATDDHDLVVMGSHGHSRVHRALLGSTSERVLKASPVPVLLMRASRPADTQPAPAPALPPR
jgi:nucleotide-binding universal stress UspA family protein